MRSAILLSLGLTLVVAAATPADDKKATPPSKDSYVKVRVEVEVRGVLTYTDKAVTVTARDRVYALYDDARELPDGASATAYTLDFARAKELRELARAFDGKEVVATGMSELRMVMPPRRAGGETGAGSLGPFPTPTWSLQRTVEVTGLKSAAAK